MYLFPSLRGAAEAIQMKKSFGLDCFAALAMTFFLTSCLTPTGTQKPAEAISYGQKGAGSAGMHTILQGDTVYTVSQKYNLPLREIISVNSLSAPYTLNTGFRLKLPPPHEYKIKPGDTLNGISRLFNVSVSEMAKLNNLSEPFTIEKGQIVRLPTAQPKLEKDFAENAPIVPSFETQTSMPVKVGAVESEVLPPPVSATNTATSATSPGQVQTASVNASAFPPQPAAKPAQVQQASVVLPSNVAPKIPPRGSGKFMRPVDGKVISGYGPKEGGLHNDGINIKAAKGVPVRAAENGVVAYVGSEMSGYGNLILIRHADRWMTAYAHMDKTLVKKGDVVKVGQSIGTVGATGQVDSPQLHFEVRKGTQAVDPSKYI